MGNSEEPLPQPEWQQLLVFPRVGGGSVWRGQCFSSPPGQRHVGEAWEPTWRHCSDLRAAEGHDATP